MSGGAMRSPGERFAVQIIRKRAWWQFWRPVEWRENAIAIEPPPTHSTAAAVGTGEITIAGEE